MKHKKYLFLQRQSPLAGGPESFDLAMTAAAFDQEVTLLLLDDGVLWLQHGLPELVEEAVDTILVEQESAIERGLDARLFSLCGRGEVTALIAAADIVVSA